MRELTKRFETVTRATLGEALLSLEETPPRGEYVLVIDGKSPEEIRAEEAGKWETMSIADHVRFYEEAGHDRKEAMRLAAKDRGLSKRDIYQALLEKQ